MRCELFWLHTAKEVYRPSGTDETVLGAILTPGETVTKATSRQHGLGIYCMEYIGPVAESDDRKSIYHGLS